MQLWFAGARRVVAFVLLWACFGAGCFSAPPGGSIGAGLVRDNNTGAVHVRRIYEGFAAQKAGILRGDRVKMIDGVLVDELDERRLRTLLRGPVGTKVTLTLLRVDQVIHVELTRTPRSANKTVRPQRRPVE